MPTNPNGTIFINYRREDSNWNALAIYNELQKYFSKDQIFKDFNAIRPGDDFVESIAGALQRCDVLLVLIGSKWLDVIDDTGKLRLQDPDDFVRLEISKALSRNIKVVPVMLDGAKMPQRELLPEPLQNLTRRQLVEIDPTRFEDDVRKLADAIRKILAESGYQTFQEPNIPRPAPQPLITPEPVSQFFEKKPPKPNNNLVWGILTTILCCLPLGIVSIISASKVDSLYEQAKYADAQKAADDAKKYALWAVGVGAVVWLIYFILVAVGVAQY